MIKVFEALFGWCGFQKKNLGVLNIIERGDIYQSFA